MKKFILGFLTAIVFIGVGFGTYQLARPHDFGDLKVIATSNGKPVAGLEIDVDSQPGPPKYRDQTDENGVVLFEELPVGRYAIFFNGENFPKELADATLYFWVTVKKDKVTEKKIVLRPK